MRKLYDYLKIQDVDGSQRYKYNDPIKNALYDYVYGVTTNVNDVLRSGEIDLAREVIKNLDDSFTSKYVSRNIIDVYRTVDWRYIKNVYKITKKNIDKYINKIFTCKSYLSTSSQMISPWASFWSDDELILHITSNKAYSYIDINRVFKKHEIDSSQQMEWLLPRDIKLKFISYSIEKGDRFSKDGTYLLEIEIV